MEYNADLMLEGGGMRCAFTVGVLDFFLDKKIEFPYVATASAGALIGSSYIAKQRERNHSLLTEMVKNRDFISFRRMLRNKELFSMDFIFNKLAVELFPLDFQSFAQSKSKFIIGTTDVNTGTPMFYDTFNHEDDLLRIIMASCSLPVLAPSVPYKDKELMDGGVSDPIPIKPLIDRGLKKHVVVLTRNKGYVKKATKLSWFFKRYFKDQPELIKLLQNRHIMYNRTMQKLLEMEQRNEVFIIQPEEPLAASRIEKNNQKLEKLYIQGYQEAERKSEALLEFLKATQKPSVTINENLSS
ncbi:patatin-like phospholipase family protein [Virgibacillus doumboii]|uniref:patatin-like phospholipase family protein n=1 Tax=Virgibacillus doumboii TaxID=2697503 RepID=UPI0013DF648A|nr:patatin family protein [Virgibacillus doumboii]